MKFKINRNRFGIVRSKEFIKLQLGNIRLYITRIPLKPKHESKARRSTRRAVFERDGHKCTCCGRELTIASLSMHHVKSRAKYPELANDVDNCISLCKPCHIRLHAEAEIERIETEEAARMREARDRAAAEIPVFSVNPVEKPLGAIMHVQV